MIVAFYDQSGEVQVWATTAHEADLCHEEFSADELVDSGRHFRAEESSGEWSSVSTLRRRRNR